MLFTEQAEKYAVEQISLIKGYWKDARKDALLLQHILDRNSQNNLILPALCNLILLDYENVDPLAYDTLVNMIFRFNNIATTQNKIKVPNLIYETEPLYKNYSFLTAILFNKNLKLTLSQRNILINIARTLPNKKMENTVLPLPHGEYPADLRYWILEHPFFEEEKETLIRELYRDQENDYYDLMTDYTRRSYLRNLSKIPF